MKRDANFSEEREGVGELKEEEAKPSKANDGKASITITD